MEVDPQPVGTGRGRAPSLGISVGVEPLPATPAVDRQVAGDPHHPRFGVVADAPPPDERTRQGLLGDVLGLAAPAEELVGHAVGAGVQIVEGFFEDEVDGHRRNRGRGDRLLVGFCHGPGVLPGAESFGLQRHCHGKDTHEPPRTLTCLRRNLTLCGVMNITLRVIDLPIHHEPVGSAPPGEW